MSKIKILAPASNFTSLQASIKAKTDAIYFGINQLNMRAKKNNNFTIDDLDEIARICKNHNIKSYLTLNSIIYDDDIKTAYEILQKVKEAKIDAVIAHDMAVIQKAREENIIVHISTQANVSNIEAVKYYSQFADTIVLARELSLEKITSIINIIKKERITGPGKELVKIEIFGHGALCIAISGKCYMSLSQYNYSANRGECLQACRRRYKVIEEETEKELIIDNNYIMSPKDLCTIRILDKIIKSGISILKIEGRARSPEYVYIVCKTYKEAIESVYQKQYTKEKMAGFERTLKEVYNRGFWHGGYYLNEDINMWAQTYGSKATKRKKYVAKITNFFAKINVAEAKIDTGFLENGQEILITGPTTGVLFHIIKDLKTHSNNLITFKINKKIRRNDQIYLYENVK